LRHGRAVKARSFSDLNDLVPKRNFGIAKGKPASKPFVNRIGIRVTSRIRNLSSAASFAARTKLEPGTQQADRRCNQKGKNESSLKHYTGNGGIVRVGADLAAAAYEDPGRAAGPAADRDYVNNHH
jgi:hypothetical protein